MSRKSGPPEAHHPHEQAEDDSTDVDYGIPPTLIEQFAPGKGRQGQLPDAVAERMRQLAGEVRVPGKAPSTAELIQLVREAVGGGAGLKAGAAWTHLRKVLIRARRGYTIDRSPEVASFVDLLIMLIEEAGMAGGNAEIFSRIARAYAAKAARARRSSGEDTRERVLEQWWADVRALPARPQRGRQARIAAALNLSESTVRSALNALKHDGVLAAETQKRD